MTPTLTVALLIVIGQHGSDRNVLALEKLGTARKAFESKVIEDPRYELEDGIYAMPLEQHVDGYYPFGVSDRRFLASLANGDKSLLYQQLRHGHARTLWRIELGGERSDKNVPVPASIKGTMARMLIRKGFLLPKEMTAQQRKALFAVKRYAAYGYGGPEGGDLWAWIVQSDGTWTSIYDYSRLMTDRAEFFPVLAIEANALGKGTSPWPADLAARPTQFVRG